MVYMTISKANMKTSFLDLVPEVDETESGMIKDFNGDVSKHGSLYSETFMKIDYKNREMMFLKAFEEKQLYIRNKELKFIDTPAVPLVSLSEISSISKYREASLNNNVKKREKKLIGSKNIVCTSDPPPRITPMNKPTFDRLLNTTFHSRYKILTEFRKALAYKVLANRISSRSKLLLRSLSKGYSIGQETQSEEKNISSKISNQQFLSISINIAESFKRFTLPLSFSPLVENEYSIEPFKLERTFSLYKPSLSERFQLGHFPRTDINVFIPIPISPPEAVIVLNEDRKVIERSPSIESDTSEPVSTKSTSRSRSRNTSTPITSIPTSQKIIQYPRDPMFYSFDPSSSIAPKMVNVPDIPIEIGFSTITSLKASEYDPFLTFDKSLPKFSPFVFSGIKSFNESGLGIMSGPDPIDLKEIEHEDDIENLDIRPKVKPITEFLTKPVSQKNPSHLLAERVVEGQSNWRDRQRNSVKQLVERLNLIQDTIHDKSLKMDYSDLNEFLLQ